jgi:hypothetical protein
MFSRLSSLSLDVEAYSQARPTYVGIASKQGGKSHGRRGGTALTGENIR